MRVIVTGAGGFIGRELVRVLLANGRLRAADGASRPIEKLVLIDVQRIDGLDDARIEQFSGDIADDATMQFIGKVAPTCVFHLAAVLTTEAERDPARALAVNVTALANIIAASANNGRPTFVYPSSIAAFGGALPDVIDDDYPQHPQTSYGTHKSIAELMLADATRHGQIDGRALRLPIILTRPGAPSPAVSDRVASLIRDVLKGIDIVCPFRPDTRLPLASVQKVAQSLIALHDAPRDAFTSSIAMNLPALTARVADMVDGVTRAGQGRKLGNVTFQPDAELQRIIDSWPKGFVSNRAAAAGIAAHAGFDEIVADYLAGET